MWIKSFDPKSMKARMTVVSLPPAYSRVLKAAVKVARREGLVLRCRPVDACRIVNLSQRSPYPLPLLRGETRGEKVQRSLTVLPSRRGAERITRKVTIRTAEITAEFQRRRLWTLDLIEVPRITRVAIVIDDLGQSRQVARRFAEMPRSLTLSVMPRLPYSRFTAEAGRHAGHEVMLHLPMQPIADRARDISPNELRVGMPRREVDRIIREDLASVPGVVGVNNHMGSRATSNARLMQEVLANLSARHLYFIDSLTTPHSVALKVAQRLGVPSFCRSVFLDDTRTVAYTLGQLRELCREAKERGAALAIGHPYPTTIKALIRFVPEFSREGIQMVPASWLVERAQVARQ